MDKEWLDTKNKRLLNRVRKAKREAQPDESGNSGGSNSGGANSLEGILDRLGIEDAVSREERVDKSLQEDLDSQEEDEESSLMKELTRRQ